MTVKERTLEDVINELGLPPYSKFNGYVVHIPETDEFLASVEKTEGVEKRAWAETPVMAKVYQDYHEALQEVNEHGKGSYVWLLFDVEDQLVAAPME